MAETSVVNLRREAFDVYIGRAGKGQDGYFGNPFTVREHGADALALFKTYFEERLATDEEFHRRVLELHGKRLGCFCKPGPCHGDVIAEWVDAEVGRDRWLSQLAKECRNCPECSNGDVPCAGCQAGGVCDAIPCSCDAEDGGAFEGLSYSDEDEAHDG